MGSIYHRVSHSGTRSLKEAQGNTACADAEELRILNVYTDRVLGGDIIVEQNIHVIDVANWPLQSRPTRACGTGGRVDWTGSEYDVGDAWDHFAVTYWYTPPAASAANPTSSPPSIFIAAVST